MRARKIVLSMAFTMTCLMAGIGMANTYKRFISGHGPSCTTTIPKTDSARVGQ